MNNMPSPLTISSMKQQSSTHMAQEEFVESYKCLDTALTSSGINTQLQLECAELARTLLGKHFAVAIAKTNPSAPPEELPAPTTKILIEEYDKMQAPLRTEATNEEMEHVKSLLTFKNADIMDVNAAVTAVASPVCGSILKVAKGPSGRALLKACKDAVKESANDTQHGASLQILRNQLEGPAQDSSVIFQGRGFLVVFGSGAAAGEQLANVISAFVGIATDTSRTFMAKSKDT